MIRNMKNYTPRLEQLEKVFRKPPPVVLRMPDGKLFAISPFAGEDTLSFLSRLWSDPLSPEAAFMANNAAILQQPGHAIEILEGMLRFKRDLLLRPIEPSGSAEDGFSVWEQAGLTAPLTEQQLDQLRAEEEHYARLRAEQQGQK
jgi:hypothetical protein